MIALDRGKRRIDEAAMRIHQHPRRADADGVQHSDQERGFILAVTVTVLEDLGSWMRLQPADPDLDAHVANFPLHKTGNALNLCLEVCRASHFTGLRCDFLGSL